MGDFFTLSVEDNFRGEIKLAYGLTILLDLADTFHEQGSCLKTISVRHSLPLAELELIATRLEEKGLLKRDLEDSNRLMLRDVPEGRWIFEIIPVLKNALRG